MGSLNYDRHTAMNHDNRNNEIRNKAIWASPNRKWLFWITQNYYEDIREIITKSPRQFFKSHVRDNSISPSNHMSLREKIIWSAIEDFSLSLKVLVYSTWIPFLHEPCNMMITSLFRVVTLDFACWVNILENLQIAIKWYLVLPNWWNIVSLCSKVATNFSI